MCEGVADVLHAVGVEKGVRDADTQVLPRSRFSNKLRNRLRSNSLHSRVASYSVWEERWYLDARYIYFFGPHVAMLRTNYVYTTFHRFSMWALVFETKPPPRTKPHRHASALSPEHGWRERERERTRKSQPPGGLYSCVLWT